MTEYENKRDQAVIYANCRNGKLSGINCADWQRSFDGFIEGYTEGQDDAFQAVVDALDKCNMDMSYGVNFSEWLLENKQSILKKGE